MVLMNTTEHLFSYGTLQDTSVQVETFGRELVGFEDQLLGYKLEMVEIQDADVVELSGKTHHPIAIATSNDADEVLGIVFEITVEECYACWQSLPGYLHFVIVQALILF